MKRLLSVVLGLGLAFPLAALAGQFPFADSPAQSSAKKPSAVRFLYPEQVTVAANKPATIELHFRINDGLHVNSHTPHEPELIPTNLVVPEIAGVKVLGVDFPQGTEYSLAADPSKKLSVYTGEFTLKMKVQIQPGDHLLQAGLRFQACDTNSCYPPRTIPVAIDLQGK